MKARGFIVKNFIIELIQPSEPNLKPAARIAASLNPGKLELVWRRRPGSVEASFCAKKLSMIISVSYWAKTPDDFKATAASLFRIS